MQTSTADPTHSRQFARLVRKRWGVSLTLTAAMLAVYYGFIAVLAFRPDLFATRLDGRLTIGIPVGLAVIVVSWLATGIYVHWANAEYDAAVDTLKNAMLEERE